MSKAKGFTLVELLLALSLLSLVMGVFYTSFSVAMKVWKEGEDDLKVYGEARLALHLITHDIRCISSTDGLYDTRKADNKPAKFKGIRGKDATGEYGPSDSLLLLTVAPSFDPQKRGEESQLLLVEYSLETDSITGRARLERREVVVAEIEENGEIKAQVTQGVEEEGGTKTVLAEGLTGLDFEYYFDVKDDAKEPWLKECRSRYGFPNLVKVTLTMEKVAGSGETISFSSIAPVPMAYNDRKFSKEDMPEELQEFL